MTTTPEIKGMGKSEAMGLKVGDRVGQRVIEGGYQIGAITQIGKRFQVKMDESGFVDFVTLGRMALMWSKV